MFIKILFTIAKIGKQPKGPSRDEQIKKAVVHIYNGMLVVKIISYHLQHHGWT